MLKLPRFVIEQLDPFAQAIYGESTWEKVHILVVGAILTTGKRTLSAVLLGVGGFAELLSIHQQSGFSPDQQDLSHTALSKSWGLRIGRQNSPLECVTED